MRSSKILLSFIFLSHVISSFAHVKKVSLSPAEAPQGEQVHISISPSTSAPDPAPTLRTSRLYNMPTVHHDADTSIDKWCKSTDYPQICESAISPFLTGPANLYKALDIAVHSAVGTTNKAIAEIKKLSTSPATPPDLAITFQDSANSLENALDNFVSAQDAIGQRDWGTVNTMLSAAISDFGEIEDMLGNQDVPQMMEFSDMLIKMTSNCLALSALFDPPPGF